MKTMRIVSALALALGLTTVGCKSNAEKADDQSKTKVLEQRPADNTGTNERDRKDTETTAQHAGMAQSDTDIMAKIRQAVVDDGNLSTNAHNVKIVAAHGIVTLKGPVGSAAEKTTVEQKAIAVVGEKNVVSELEIAP